MSKRSGSKGLLIAFVAAVVFIFAYVLIAGFLDKEMNITFVMVGVVCIFNFAFKGLSPRQAWRERSRMDRFMSVGAMPLVLFYFLIISGVSLYLALVIAVLLFPALWIFLGLLR